MSERDPHHSLNQPASRAHPTEWPDPYDRRPDPRFPPPDADEEEPHPPAGGVSTSDPHPEQDPEAIRSKAGKRRRKGQR